MTIKIVCPTCEGTGIIDAVDNTDRIFIKPLLHTFPRSYHEKIIGVVSIANEILSSHVSQQAIYELPAFDFSKHINGEPANGKQVWDSMMKCPIVANLKGYRFRWPRHRNVNGYFTRKKPEYVHYNLKKLRRDEMDMVETAIHEFEHLTDFDDKKVYYGHGSSSPVGKANSAPRLIPRILVDLYIKGKI